MGLNYVKIIIYLVDKYNFVNFVENIWLKKKLKCILWLFSKIRMYVMCENEN